MPRLQQIEQAAAQRFRAVGLAACADAALLLLEVLRAQQQAGHLWVVAAADGAPAGFALVYLLDGCGHLHEMDVHPTKFGSFLVVSPHPPVPPLPWQGSG